MYLLRKPSSLCHDVPGSGCAYQPARVRFSTLPERVHLTRGSQVIIGTCCADQPACATCRSRHLCLLRKSANLCHNCLDSGCASSSLPPSSNRRRPISKDVITLLGWSNQPARIETWLSPRRAYLTRSGCALRAGCACCACRACAFFALIATHKTAIIHLPRSQSLVATTALTRVPTTANSSQCSCGHPQYTCLASHWWPQLGRRDLSQDPPLSKDPPLPPNVRRCVSPLARQGCTTQRAQIFQTSASQQRRRAARRRRRTPATRIMTDLRAATDSPIVTLCACAVGPPRILATPTIPHP